MAPEDDFTVGEQAMDFELKNYNGKPFKLSDHKGERVLLSFLPKATGKIDKKFLKDLEKKKRTLKKYKTLPVGIVMSSVADNKKLAKQLKIKNTALLSDSYPKGAVAKHYGIYDPEAGEPERAIFIIDEEQQISLHKTYEGNTGPDIQRIVDYLKA